MDVYINHGILHIIDNERGQVALSESELDLDSDMVTEFLTRHIKKLLGSSSAKEATFEAESSVLDIMGRFRDKSLDFKQASHEICAKLAEIMMDNKDIAPADILITQFEIKNMPHFGIFKLNHSTFYTHEVKDGENHIVQSAFALPLSGSKVSEAVVIPYNPMVLKIIEKPHIVGGEKINYFSQLFLQSSANISKKDAVKYIKAQLEETVDTHYASDPLVTAKFHIAIIEDAIENDGEIRLENSARIAFGDSQANEEFIFASKEAGLGGDLFLGEKFVSKEFGYLKIKNETGVEIKLPVGVMDDANVIEFNGPSVVIKNMRNIDV